MTTTIPCIVGVHRTTRKKGRGKVSPLELYTAAAEGAIKDAQEQNENENENENENKAKGKNKNENKTKTNIKIDSLTIIDTFAEGGVKILTRGKEKLYENPAACVASRLPQCEPSTMVELVNGGEGGDSPQRAVNRACRLIAQSGSGINTCLIVGAEARNSWRPQGNSRAMRELETLGWGESRGEVPGGTAEWDGVPLRDANNFSLEAEIGEDFIRHKVFRMASIYPLFEQRLCHEARRSLVQHERVLAELYAAFSNVAARSPEHSWRGSEAKFSVAELLSGKRGNRFITKPFYRRWFVADQNVDMGSAILLMSVAEAQRLGIQAAKCIVPVGGASAIDLPILERPVLTESVALRRCAEVAMSMAGVSDVDSEVQVLDIYSCFPSAVQVLCRELRVNCHSPQRPLTVTGGLSFHGGPGNSYVCHAIVAAVEKMRTTQCSTGLICANGGALSAHAVGIYKVLSACDSSTLQDLPAKWAASQPLHLQLERHPVATAPNGLAKVETYCLELDHAGKPARAIVVGKVADATNARFLSVTLPTDFDGKGAMVLEELDNGKDHCGRTCHVVQCGKRNAIAFFFNKM
eukprot:g2848.t1